MRIRDQASQVSPGFGRLRRFQPATGFALSRTFGPRSASPWRQRASGQRRASQIDRSVCGVERGTFANFGQYRFFAWMAGDCTFAVVGAKRAEFEPVLPALHRFTREALLATR